MSTVSLVQAPPRIADAVKKASDATGTDFDYLLQTAANESSFRADARAKTSSATGLFQFVDDTWLQMVKEEGPRFGLGDYSAFILKGRGGRHSVSDPALRREILALRKDPEIAAKMAGALTERNEAHVGARLGREPTSGELYMAHVLGAEGASRLIELANDRPNAPADRYFSRAARANRAIFYSDQGARSVSDVYDILARKHGPATAASARAAPAPGLPEPKPASAIESDPATATYFTAVKPVRTPAPPPAGAIGQWTTLLRPSDEGPAMAGVDARRVEPLVAGSLARQPGQAAAAEPQRAATVEASRRVEPAAPPKSIRIPSAAFNLFHQETLGRFELGGA